MGSRAQSPPHPNPPSFQQKIYARSLSIPAVLLWNLYRLGQTTGLLLRPGPNGGAAGWWAFWRGEGKGGECLLEAVRSDRRPSDLKPHQGLQLDKPCLLSSFSPLFFFCIIVFSHFYLWIRVLSQTIILCDHPLAITDVFSCSFNFFKFILCILRLEYSS